MQPLAGRVLQMIYPLLEEDQQELAKLEGEHRKTLNLLRQVVKGEMDPSRVIVSDDGWQIMPEQPSE